MKFSIRIVLVLVFFSLCVAGAIVAAHQSARLELQKRNAMPVKTHDSSRRIWIQA